MALPWVRLDSNIATHDKILALLQMKDGHKAAFMYVCSLGYSGGHGTDGLIEFIALPFIHGTPRLATLCVEVGLWQPVPRGWVMKNWADRQELAAITEQKRAAQSMGGVKGNCIKYHGPSCGCWEDRVA